MALPWWVDEAVENPKDDEFKRLPYAEHAANLIRGSYSPDASVVFGLSGPWGSGKSSLANLIIKSLKKADGEWIVARFTPWAASDVDSLLSEFYSSLSDALPEDRRTQVKESFGKLARIAAPAAKLIPLVGSAASEYVERGANNLLKAPSWNVAFGEATAQLASLRKPVLIVADDIDRLQNDELWTLLKVVRLLGRFPGVQYLLAYDEQTLFRAIAGEASSSFGQQFMEKIVQYPLSVPPLLESQRLKLLDTGLTHALSDHERPEVNEERLSSVASSIIAELTTPRSIHRFIASVRYHLPMLPASDVDDADLIILLAIRAAFPDIYARIPEFKDSLISGSTSELMTGSMFEKKQFDPGELLGNLSGRSQRSALKMLETLFPNLSPGIGYNDFTGRRMSNILYFDRYLVVGIPENDVSDLTVASAMNSTRSGDPEPLLELITGDGDLAFLVLTKAQEISIAAWSVEERLALIAVLTNAYGFDLPGSTLFRVNYRMIRWASKILSGLPAEAVVGEVKPALASLDEVPWMQTIQRAAHDANRSNVGSNETGRPWLDELHREAADLAARRFLDHLAEGDNAGTGSCGFWVSVATSNGDVAKLRGRVQDVVNAGRATMSDVAARMVTIESSLQDGDPVDEIGEVSQETWNEIAPRNFDEWYARPRRSVNLYDTSWGNRKLYVEGRLTDPDEPGAQV